MNKLKKIRRACGGISLRVLAIALDKQGTKVGWTHLNHYEIGKTSLSAEKLLAIANFFQISVGYLKGEKRPQTRREKIIEGVIYFQDTVEKEVDAIYDG